MKLSPTAKAKVLDVLMQYLDSWMFDAAERSKFLLEEIEKSLEEETFSTGIIERQKEEANLDTPHFFGAVEEIDQKPLTKSAFKIFAWMVSHCHDGEKYFTHEEVSASTGIHLTTVGNRIRDFRMEQWGAHHTPRRRRGNTRMWEYSMIPNKESFTWKYFAQDNPQAA